LNFIILSKTDLSGDGNYSKDLQENLEYDGLNRLRYARFYQAGSQTATQEVRYDDAGNITYKTGIGSYEYNGPRPHAVTKAGNTSYHYDNNGNISSDSGSRTLEYTVFDKPSLVTKGGHDTRFTYGPDRSRYRRVDDNGKGTVTTLQIGSVEKVIERSTSGAHIKSFYRRNIAGVAIERVELNASDEIAGISTQYLHKDLQGSLDVITDSTGQVAKDAAGNKLVYSFDAWGKRRNALSWEQIAGAPANTVSALSVGAFNHLSSNRGYTGHEMLDEVGLIHMNGRVYDPTLARFVSADPMIDGVTSVQGYNRYAYVHNNPLTYTDPSGYSSWNKYRDSVVKPVVAVVIAVYTGGQSLVALQATNYAAAVGWAAAGGAAAGAVQSGTVKGAFFGAFSAVAFMGIGNAFQGAGWATKGVVGKGIMGTGLNGYGYAAKVFAHSVAGGLLSEAQGGKFKHGFAAAGVTQAFAGGIDSIDASNVGFSTARVIAAAIVGGTASVVSGGKFANGAITAAFSRALNDEVHPSAQKGITKEDQARFVGYVEFDDIPSIVNNAVAKSGFWDKFLGRAGYQVDQLSRYIYVKDLGWIDLQHVVSAATAPGASIGLSIDLGHNVENGQWLTGSSSAWKTEDLVSNYLGSMAAHHKTFYGAKSLGHSTQYLIGRFQHMTRGQAMTHIHNNGSGGLDIWGQ
jgi:RHS repeat-associated protein